MSTPNKIAILSAGPSLLTSWPQRQSEPWDAVIAVNGAGLKFEHDYFCWMDAQHVVAMVEAGIKPRLGSVWKFPDFRWCGHDRTYHEYPVFTGGMTAPFTLPNAILWTTYRFRPSAITIFGMDNTEEPCVAGYQSGHHENRWNLENAWMNLATQEGKVKRD